MALFQRRKTSVSSGSHLPVSRKGAQFAPEVVQTVRAYGLGMSSYGAMYRGQPWVRACVDFLARNIAQLNPKVYERAGNTDRIERGDHPLSVLLRYPNPSTTRYAHLRDTVADLAVYDLAYWVKDRELFPRSLVRLAPSQVTVEDTPNGRVYRDPRGQVIPRNRLVIFQGYNPDGDEGGVSPLETLRRVLQEATAADIHRENFWRNAARQSGVIERPLDAPPWSDSARERFRADWEGSQTGHGNAGRTAILEEGMTHKADSFSPKDSEYIAGRMLTRREVAIAYGIAPELVGAGESTNVNLEASHRHLYQDTLGPWLRMLQDEMELQLLPSLEPLSTSRSVYVEFNLAEKLKGSFEEQQRALTTAVGVPHMSVNEGRARVNLPRIEEPWADVPVQPLNVMYGGQPATTVPTDVPGTASAVPQTKASTKVDEDGRDETVDRFRTLMKSYFDRQERSVLSGFKTKASHNRDRWNSELQADLYTQSTATVDSFGRQAAAQMQGRFDESRVRGWLLANSERTAQSVNDFTFDALEAADSLDEARHVFEVAQDHRANLLAASLATTLLAFAFDEAGRHTADATGRPITKTWVVTADDSRHPEMNGQTVPISGTFSNGAKWPGDPVLGADETAGCACLLTIGEGP
jgi:HK97 family phage portal protein